MNRTHNIGIASQIGTYSDAVEVPPNSRLLFTAGAPGLGIDGRLPETIAEQARLAWANIVGILERAGMGVGDLVKVTQFLLRAEDIAEYAKVRAEFLGSARPASMLLVVPALVRPGFLLEIEAVAASA
jgi:2-iminobutanoate/2-iminopropanoate deaminase